MIIKQIEIELNFEYFFIPLLSPSCSGDEYLKKKFNSFILAKKNT